MIGRIRKCTTSTSTAKHIMVRWTGYGQRTRGRPSMGQYSMSSRARIGLTRWYRGKTLGGGTSINGGAWTRGLNAQYDAWSKLLEDSEASVGWNWDGMFSYMKKVRSLARNLHIWLCIESAPQAETFSAPNAQQQAKGAASIASYHGTTGPVQVTFPDAMYGGPHQKAFVDTVVSLTGIKHFKDLNGGTPNCISMTPLVCLRLSCRWSFRIQSVRYRPWIGTRTTTVLPPSRRTTRPLRRDARHGLCSSSTRQVSR